MACRRAWALPHPAPCPLFSERGPPAAPRRPPGALPAPPRPQVLTGVVSGADLAEARRSPGFREPDFVMRSFGDLLDVAPAASKPQPQPAAAPR
jgi:hypothetical protein